MMMAAWCEELIYSESEDGLDLEGVAIRPSSNVSQSTAILWIHGNTSNFYAYPYVVIGRALAQRGFLFVSGNTRGHDIAASLWNLKQDKEMAGGSAWEKLEDAPLDIGGWVQYTMTLGVKKVVLVGHSQGAAKVTLYQGQRQDGRISGVALASPDLRGHWSNAVAEARTLVESRRGDEVLPVIKDEPWYRLSAHNVISRADVLDHVYDSQIRTPDIAAIQHPILAFFGTNHDVGARAELETLKQNAVKSVRLDTALIDSADHVYVGHEEQVADVITRWIEAL
jgi:pimeloyl-ACP methyl ester carboxylesterase